MRETRCALVLLDVQPSVLGWSPDAAEILPRLAAAVAAAREADIPVVFVSVKFRLGHPDVSPNNQSMTMAASSGALDEDLPETLPCAELDPRLDDLYVTKRRVGAFAGSELELLLRSKQIDGVVLGGLTTAGAVLSTVRAAADLDLEVTVLTDGCFDDDPDVHRVLTTKVFPTQADLLTVEEWVAGLGTRSGPMA